MCFTYEKLSQNHLFYLATAFRYSFCVAEELRSSSVMLLIKACSRMQLLMNIWLRFFCAAARVSGQKLNSCVLACRCRYRRTFTTIFFFNLVFFSDLQFCLENNVDFVSHFFLPFFFFLVEKTLRLTSVGKYERIFRGAMKEGRK